VAERVGFIVAGDTRHPRLLSQSDACEKGGEAWIRSKRVVDGINLHEGKRLRALRMRFLQERERRLTIAQAEISDRDVRGRDISGPGLCDQVVNQFSSAGLPESKQSAAEIAIERIERRARAGRMGATTKEPPQRRDLEAVTIGLEHVVGVQALDRNEEHGSTSGRPGALTPGTQ
jgi:hypothetical protein